MTPNLLISNSILNSPGVFKSQYLQFASFVLCPCILTYIDTFICAYHEKKELFFFPVYFKLSH